MRNGNRLGWMSLVLGLMLLAGGGGTLVSAEEPATPATENPPVEKSSQESEPSQEKATEPDAAKKAGADKEAGAGKSVKATPADDDLYELYEVFADTLDQVERNYVKPVSRRELMEAAINGVLAKLDPYSSYIGRNDMSQFKSTVESQFGGIGIQITKDHDQLRILSPLYGTPAYRAGLQANDAILEIAGTSTEGMSLDEAVRRLKGEAGTNITLTVGRGSQAKRDTVTLMREVIHVDTVLGDRRKSDDTWDFMIDPDRKLAYIRITSFSRDTPADLKKALEELSTRGLKGLVIDLRFNLGGLLTAAIETSDLFISSGKIVSTQGRNTPQRTWDAEGPGTFEGFPIAILVNRYSASASEIVSACLQDHKRAIVIGERTWGKGSVQNVIELENGRSALKLTTASYQRPSGKNIHRFPDAKESDEWGVMPNSGFEMRLNDVEMGELLVDRRHRDILFSHAKAAAEDKTDAETKTATDTPASATDVPAVDPQADQQPDPAEKPAEDKPTSDKSTPSTTDTPTTSPEKTDAGKTDAEKTDAPKADSAKTEADKPAGEKTVATTKPRFVDRQLQKALDYLTQELARAQ